MNPVTLMDVLQAREDRVRRQNELLSQFHRPLVSFTMNIAGPVKDTPLIRRGFESGRRMMEQQFLRMRVPVLHHEVKTVPTGCEAIWVADLAADRLKQLTTEVEEASALGRLFDLDVLTADGTKLDRPMERACLICGKPGRSCARSRAHTVEALQEKTNQILQDSLHLQDRHRAAELACRALLYEVCVTPKPGLVDRSNSGSHRDMDCFTFMSSAASLWPYFETCTKIGQQTASQLPEETFCRLRLPGKVAENAMLSATSGVNTHKGAIFSMGIVCAALGRLEPSAWRDPAAVLTECASMTRGLVERDFSGLTAETAVTAGERFYVRHGVTGIRGQMEAGLPTVLSHGLPALEAALQQGKTNDEAGLAALLALIRSTEDTNLLSRGGWDGQQWAITAASTISDPEELDQAYIARNLSPGGCADLLAVCWMLHFLQSEP